MFSPDISNDGSTRDACEEIVEKKKGKRKTQNYHLPYISTCILQSTTG